jgi:Cytochrome bd terminal oxidase subunit II
MTVGPVWLVDFWAGVIAFSSLMHVVLDSYDLSFGTMRSERHRSTMMGAIALYWDGNETWLILVGTGLLAASWESRTWDRLDGCIEYYLTAMQAWPPSRTLRERAPSPRITIWSMAGEGNMEVNQ